MLYTFSCFDAYALFIICLSNLFAIKYFPSLNSTTYLNLNKELRNSLHYPTEDLSIELM